MKIRAALLLAILFFANAGCSQRLFYTYRPENVTPPAVPREFRGAWVTVVANNQDWPSSPNLSVAQQKAELISLLDRAQQLHLNAIIFQVRPACDAVYQSSIEPWSAYLTGTQGKAPQPFYDPLAFAIQEAHKRGLELHAWFNPFRAWHLLSKSPVAANHISRTHPEWIRHYGSQLLLDPGEPAVRDYVARVILDVVKRYDVDGIQIDDYFYPYPEKDASGRVLEFPDFATWKKYGQPNGIGLEDWRRQNVNEFVQKIYREVKAAKLWVKVGISPFGIWRPNNPAPIRGMDAYATLYADSRLWLANGWVDYLAPQLYWPIDPPAQSFTTLLNWWTQQNKMQRNIFSGISAANVGDKFPANEIARQIAATRAQSGASGEIFFHLRNLLDDPRLNQIARAGFSQPALGPAWPWLSSTLPKKPKLLLKSTKDGLDIHWENSGDAAPWQWVLQVMGTNHLWTTHIFPATQMTASFGKPVPNAISIRAVDRLGNLSEPAAVRKILYQSGGKR
ncbi:MAG TPA: family 10 glycosylhydrolase [Verrucomicrobiae bacterium]|nr:family 10 glycosylhydrolase [Verrucomicrobiae bacterium]